MFRRYKSVQYVGQVKALENNFDVLFSVCYLELIYEFVRTYLKYPNWEIPKLEIPGFSGFTNPKSRDFIKLIPRFS